MRSFARVSFPSERAWADRARARFAGQSENAGLVLEHLPEATLAATADGIITLWNRAACVVFGYSSEEIVGRNINDLAGAGSAVTPLIQHALKEKRLVSDDQLRGRARNGLEFDLHLSIAPLPDADSVVITARNITYAKRNERRAAAEYAVTRALSESTSPEHAFRRVLAAVSAELAWAYAALWTPRRSNYLECAISWHSSDRSLADFDRENRRVRLERGRGLPGRVWSEGVPIWIEDFYEADFPRAALSREADLRCAIGVPIIVGGDLFGVMEFFAREVRVRDDAVLRTMLGIGSEVGQYILRVRAEEEMRTSEQRFRTLAQSASDAIVTLDDNSRIQYANPAVQRIFGYAPEALIGRRIGLLMPKRFRAAHRKGMRHYLQTGIKNIPWSSIELVGRHRDCHEVPIEISFGEFTAGHQHFFTGVIRDVTDRQQEREVLENALQARSEFLAAMSHELRTPLQAVIGYGGLLQARLAGPLTEQQEQHLMRIQLSAEHLLQLIDQVLDVSRADAGTLRLQIEDVDIAEIIAQACTLLGPQVDAKHLRLHCEIADDERLKHVRADRQRLRQILLNLLTNAVKFTDAGSIEVHATIDASGHYVFIDVVDTGIGIAPEAAARIFEPFYQAETAFHKRASGIGLGLSIVKRLTEAMNGTVSVQSMPQRGSRFRITLPVTAAPLAE